MKPIQLMKRVNPGMNKIYVVVSEMDYIDDYSYHIEKAFLEESEAKKYCKKMNKKTGPDLTFN